jgi:hypothetical protein
MEYKTRIMVGYTYTVDELVEAFGYRPGEMGPEDLDVVSGKLIATISEGAGCSHLRWSVGVGRVTFVPTSLYEAANRGPFAWLDAVRTGMEVGSGMPLEEVLAAADELARVRLALVDAGLPPREVRIENAAVVHIPV